MKTKTDRLYLRLEPELKAWLEAKANAEHLEVSAFVRQTLWKMKEQEKNMSTIYINQSDEYGDAVPVTIEDYQELNPDGNFVIAYDGIREIFSDTPGDFEIIAISQEDLDQQNERDNLLRST